MRKLSIFCDESGQQDMSAGYYLVTIVWHDQGMSIAGNISAYESTLALAGLPDIPFHMVDLLHGHGDYKNVDQETRYHLLMRFNTFVRKLPITYTTFSYRSYDTEGSDKLLARMSSDFEDMLIARHDRLVPYGDKIVYYDNGQETVSSALHETFDHVASGCRWRPVRYQDRRLSQVADYVCSVELASIRYRSGTESSTYRKFFGRRERDFRKDFLKQLRRKMDA